MLSVSKGPGFDNVAKSILQHAKIVRVAVRKSLREHRPIIKSEAHRLMELPKHGQTYVVYRSKSGRRLKRGRKHVASKPGEPFAWMTGDTFRSMSFRLSGWNNMRFGFGTAQGRIWELHKQRTVLKRVLTTTHQIFVRNVQRNIFADIEAVAKGGA